MPAGRPTSYKPEYCETVIELGKQGKSVAQMCAHFDISRQTINNWASDHPEFLEAFTRAKTHMQAVLEAMAFDGLKNREFNANLWKTTMQARFREDYTERKEVSGPDGGPIEVGYKSRLADILNVSKSG
jgi:hypothetical protein